MTNELILPENPTLNDFQKYIEKMKKERGFNTTDPVLEMLFLTEEVGELASAIRRVDSKGHSDKNKVKENNIGGEIADCLIFLLSLSNMYNVDLEHEFRKKEEKNKKRIWVKQDGKKL